MLSQAALLIGKITHARKEWEELSSIVQLKVGALHELFHAIELTVLQEYGTGTREEFISNCKAGKYNDVVVIYRSNESTSVGLT